MVSNWQWLKTDYPFEQTTREKGNTILFVSVFASLLVLLLQPFGFSIAEQFNAFSGFLIVSTLTLVVNYYGFPYCFPSLFEERQWSVSKAFLFLLYNFIIIGFWNHIISSLLNQHTILALQSGNDLILMVFRTVAVGTIASFFLILIKYNFLARKNLQISQELNREIKNQLSIPLVKSGQKNIKLILDNKTISFEREHLIYISAEGNYIKLIFRNSINQKPQLYRSTLKQAETALEEFPEFFKCHRSFIINLNAIESSSGNSQGLSVKMAGQDLKIPVARPKIKSLKHHLDQIKKQF